MRDAIHHLRRRLLNEAAGREDHADALGDWAVSRPSDVNVPTLTVLARSQRIRAMELRGTAIALYSPGQGRAHAVY